MYQNEQHYIIFGMKLADLRHQHNITQKKLSEDLQINRVAIARYEAGVQSPTLDSLISIAKYFDVSTDYLLGFSEINENLYLSDTYDINNSSEFIYNIGLIKNHCKSLHIPFEEIFCHFLRNDKFIEIFQKLCYLILDSYENKKRGYHFSTITTTAYKYELLKLFDELLSKYDCVNNSDIYRIMKNHEEASENGNDNPKEE